MTEWSRALPLEPGNYWIYEDHWCDGEPVFGRVFRDLDRALMFMAVGWADPVRLDVMPWPSYWMEAATPRPPVFA